MANVLIWGASGGIGRAITETFVAAGHTAFAVARRTEGLDTLTPHVLAGDVADQEAVSRVARQAAEAVAPVDVFIYAVGDILSAAEDFPPSPRSWACASASCSPGVTRSGNGCIIHPVSEGCPRRLHPV